MGKVTALLWRSVDLVCRFIISLKIKLVWKKKPHICEIQNPAEFWNQIYFERLFSFSEGNITLGREVYFYFRMQPFLFETKLLLVVLTQVQILLESGDQEGAARVARAATERYSHSVAAWSLRLQTLEPLESVDISELFQDALSRVNPKVLGAMRWIDSAVV